VGECDRKGCCASHGALLLGEYCLQSCHGLACTILIGGHCLDLWAAVHAVEQKALLRSVFGWDAVQQMGAVNPHGRSLGTGRSSLLEHLQFSETTLTNDYRLQLSSKLSLN
jgi:hypothetical protein